MKRIVTQYLRPYYGRMLVGFAIKFSGTCLDLCLPWVLARMIDVVIPQGERRAIFAWGLVMLGLAAGAAICNITANRMAARVAAGSTQAVRADLFSKVMYLSDSQSGELGKPSLISRLTTDTYNVYNVIGRVQRLGVRAPLLLIGGLCITMTLDAHLACILLAALAILAVVVVTVSRRSVPMYGQLQKALDRLVMSVRENIAGIRVIKALSKEDWEKERFAGINDQVVQREKAAGLTMAVINPVMNLVLKNTGLSDLFYHYPECAFVHFQDDRHHLPGNRFRGPHRGGAVHGGRASGDGGGGGGAREGAGERAVLAHLFFPCGLLLHAGKEKSGGHQLLPEARGDPGNRGGHRRG